MKKSIRIFNNLLTILLFVALLFVLISVFFSNMNNDETNIFGYQFKSVLSGSMEPNIKTGSIIAIKSDVNKEELNRDDIITFLTEDNTVVTHRIVETDKTKNQFITKGDSNSANDISPVSYENVIGEYHGFTIPLMGYLLHFISSDMGKIILLITPGIILIIHSFIIFLIIVRHLSHSQSKTNNEGNT